VLPPALPWNATVQVVDEASQPIAGANVLVSYSIRSAEGKPIHTNVTGITDANGVFMITHDDPSIYLGFNARKNGYYSTSLQYEIGYSPEKHLEKLNPNFTLILKSVINRIPMYVNRMDIAHQEKPATEKPVGFDLMVGDWVAPYGKGSIAHMLFTWHTDYDTNVFPNLGTHNNQGWESKLTVSFPNPGDGIQEFDAPKEGGSELRSSQQAPSDGYLPILVKLQSWHPDRAGTNSYDHLRKNYYVRVQTVLDDKGNVKSALY